MSNIIVVCGAAQSGGQGFLFGFRVPKDYFIAKGYGDTNDVRPAPQLPVSNCSFRGMSI